MKNEILDHLGNPAQLEKLYRADKQNFKRAFTDLYPEIKDDQLAVFWHERLNYVKEEILWGSAKDLLFVFIASLLAGVVAKLPEILSVNEEFFYTRNIGFIVLPFLTAYFIWKNNLSIVKIIFISVATLVGVIFINSFPGDAGSDTLILSSIHLPLFLWAVLGFAFVGEITQNNEKRLDFLRYNGDLVVMTTLIVIAGGIMTGLTIGLFGLIGLSIEKFWFEYVVIFGLPAAPVFGTYLTRNNPQLVGKVSPVIARIFSPLVLIMLVAYLIAIVYTGKDPYNDREFLLIFNILLIGVLAIIFFSVAARSQRSRGEIWILLLLSIVTIIVNCIALSAILFRISEWGITPNRTAVLGANILILFNLVLVTLQLYKILSKKSDINDVGKAISIYLPVYFIWTVIVTFIFPMIFGFK